MVIGVKLIALLWLSYWTFVAVRDLAGGARQSIFFVIIAHFIFCGAPLLFDLCLGQPHYAVVPGFLSASRDATTEVIYCLYISACVIVWLSVGRSRTTAPRTSLSGEALLARGWRPVFWVLLVAPIVVVAFAPQPFFYLRYAAVAVDEAFAETSVREYHAVITAACNLSLLAGVMLLLAPTRRLGLGATAMIAVCLFVDAWLNGKRHFVAFELLLLLYIVWRRGNLRGLPAVAAGVAAAAFLVAFSFAYQHAYRDIGLSESGWQATYTNLRIDYGRDDVIKLAIYSELHPREGRILEYRGQSLFFYLTCFLPRDAWPDKPYPYGVYVTSRLHHTAPRPLGWTMTTSILEESIANFSWFGVILGPLIVAGVCRFGDGCRSDLTGSLTALVACLFLAQHFIAFLPIAAVWFALTIYHRRRRRLGVRGLNEQRQEAPAPGSSADVLPPAGSSGAPVRPIVCR